MSTSLVNFVVANGMAKITLCRPQKRNALNRQLINELQTCVERASSDPTVRALFLAAEGPVFCAGMDLGEMESRAGSANPESEWQQDTETYCELLISLWEFPHPTVAVVQGPALAGGMGLVCACDFVICTETAWFSLPEPKRGITAAVVMPLLLYRVGVAHATPMLLATQNLSTQRAAAIGFCQEIVQESELESASANLFSELCNSAPGALATTKKHLREISGKDLKAELQAGMQVSAEARGSAEAREGLTAFLEKRSPNWIMPDEK